MKAGPLLASRPVLPATAAATTAAAERSTTSSVQSASRRASLTGWARNLLTAVLSGRSSSPVSSPEQLSRSAVTVVLADTQELASVEELLQSTQLCSIVTAVAQKYARLVDVTVLGSEEDSPGQKSVFCGKCVPKVSLSKYLARLLVSLNRFFDPEQMFKERGDLTCPGLKCLLIGTIFLDRLLTSRPEFRMTAFNIHRLFFAAIALAMKTIEDSPPPLQFLSLAAGIEVHEAVRIESAFCRLLRFNLYFSNNSEIRARYEEFFQPLGLRVSDDSLFS